MSFKRTYRRLSAYCFGCYNTKIYDAFILIIRKEKHLCIVTYCGSLWCSAAIEVLNILEEEPILQNANQNAPYFTNLIREELEDYHYVGDIRSIGLINAIELVQDKESKTSFDSSHRYGYQIYKTALKKGLLLRPLGDILYFNPPLIMTREEMKKAVKICADSIREVMDNI
ncbi:MAG: aminotransferase class III-fold pyridoxal phosphate-dependent enzyme [Acutalibacteraceae bacterium]